MVKRPKSDFWTVGVVPERLDRLSPERLRELRDRIVWMPEAGDWRYYADPFALREGDALHVFVEHFDYRTKRADLQRLTLNLADGAWSTPQPVLRQPFHLSYPFVFEHEGQVWMVPESSQAAEVALYRAVDGAERWERWERVCALLPGVHAVDASLLRHEGRWWMFYAVIGPDKRDQRELHLAWADTLQGPWTPHAANPVRSAHDGARPAGTPFVDADGRVTLPVQDSRTSYGGATRWLRFDRLTPQAVEVRALPATFTGDLAHPGFLSGLHTMSACGDLTLIDVKRIDRSRHRQWLDWKRRVRRWFGQR
ncbi:glycosyl hydrolase family 43 [Mitsuaria sp. TWR114]|uniref:glucosamine inositolphosphorylceramide transferase family protein n=1 Tax=Mitsuaria sp. TWR114 TaxID=2601731 RepID=UPI0011BFD1DC|nr:glycosyl hydrolase family 43 [Mitsuaria sp. TWR114]TXD80871.1 glycosyl hydrolase family 43 [Mitsuaria sp. TWR114]